MQFRMVRGSFCWLSHKYATKGRGEGVIIATSFACLTLKIWPVNLQTYRSHPMLLVGTYRSHPMLLVGTYRSHPMLLVGT